MSDGLTAEGKIKSLPMVYIKGEEMTRYAAQLMLENWLEPHVDTSAWEFFDLSCAARDASNDQTLKDAVRARRPAVLRCLHAIDARRLQERMSWLVSFSNLGPIGPSRATATPRAGPGTGAWPSPCVKKVARRRI